MVRPLKITRGFANPARYKRRSFAIVFQKNNLTLVGAYPCGRPVGQAQGIAPTQKHYLKNYIRLLRAMLRSEYRDTHYVTYPYYAELFIICIPLGVFK